MLAKIDPERARNLIWNYHHENTYQKSVSVTYDVKQLKDFVDQCIADGDPFVRVYFGQYGKNNTRIPVTHIGHRTVIFVPVDSTGKDHFSAQIVQPPFDEGQICPPPDPCTGSELYDSTEDANFDPTVQH